MDKLYISYYSIVSAIIFFNIGLLVIIILRHNLMFFVMQSTWCLFALFSLSIIRVLLPLDMPKGIVFNSYKIYPEILTILHNPSPVGGLTIGSILFIAWILGIVVLIINDTFQYIIEIHTIKNFVLMDDAQVQRIAREKFATSAKIFVSPNIQVPTVTGLFKPYIYLPPIDLTDNELRCILKHELCHFYGGDIIIKFFYTILKDIFWWDPLIYLFHSEVDNLLELRCDQAVIKNMTHFEKVNYLNTILKVIKQFQITKQNDCLSKSAIKFVNYNLSDITEQRFQIIAASDKPKNSTKQIMTFIVIITLYALSLFVIIQPAYTPDFNTTDTMVEITKDNAYILQLKETLELYVDNEFWGYVSVEQLNTLPYSNLIIIKEK